VWDCGGTWEQRVRRVRSEGGAPTGDPDADAAYDHAGTVRDYLRSQLARDSVDGHGMPLLLNVHYGVRYMNAYWDGDEMTFGDGDGKVFLSFTRSLEVVAHELAHGVTQFTAALEYRGQPGALNEHFSDVFGAAISQHAEGVTAQEADWLVGNEVIGPQVTGVAIRSMKDPGTAYDDDVLGRDPQPAHMDDLYTGQDDDGGVHINSGIPNRAFVLTALRVGTPAAMRVWYAALLRLWATAVFNDAVAVIGACATELARTGDVPAGTPDAVREAFAAVGLPR